MKTIRYRSGSSAVAILAVIAGGLLAPCASRAAGSNPDESVDTTVSATDVAQSLVGPGVEISNVMFTGADDARGTFSFVDPNVVGVAQGIILSSGNANDVVGPNTQDGFSTDWVNPGDADLTTLSGFDTFDAAVLEFDFVPDANQVTFQYAFSSDEYSEYVGTPFNDVFAFFIDGINCAEVRETAGDPGAPFVPVAVNNINNGNHGTFPPDPLPVPMRPDLFRENYFNELGPSLIDLEMDGITRVITCQAAVVPGETSHMKLAIADASDGILDSAVFIQAGSLVSNENPTADLGLVPDSGTAPLDVTATVEGEDPNDLALTFTIDWGDGTSTPSQPLTDLTAVVNHTYEFGGEFIVTLTVSNGTLSGTDQEDVDVIGPPMPTPTPGGPTPTPTPESPTPTPTPESPTPTPTPEPTASPTPTPAHDHFTCYSAGPSKHSVKFVKRTGDSLVDEFGPSTVSVTKPKYLCAPTNKLGEDPGAPTRAEHLEGYSIKPAVKFGGQAAVPMLDQFTSGGLIVDAKKPTLLLVPSLKVPGGPTPPTPADFVTDHFQCYAVKVTKGTRKFTAIPDVTLQDQFGSMTVDVKKLKYLCVPVDVNGSDPTAPGHASHLMCYQIKRSDGLKFTKQTSLFVNNPLGPTTLDAKKPALLCAPALMNP